jgi:hypothetical protein
MTDSEMPMAKFMRLKNGDDIIAEIIEMGDDDNLCYLLMNPLKLVYVESRSPGYVQIAFMPWVFPKICDKQEFTIDSNDVILITEITEKMNGYYWDNIETFENYKSTGKIVAEEEETQAEEYEAIKEMLEGMANKRTLH